MSISAQKRGGKHLDVSWRSCRRGAKIKIRDSFLSSWIFIFTPIFFAFVPRAKKECGRWDLNPHGIATTGT